MARRSSRAGAILITSHAVFMFQDIPPPRISCTNSSMGGSMEDLVKRFHDLEVSQANLRDQLQWMLGEGSEGHGPGMRRREDGDADSDPFLPGHFAHGPYRSVLQHVGHALHIYRPHTGEIIFCLKLSNSYPPHCYITFGKEASQDKELTLVILRRDEAIPYGDGMPSDGNQSAENLYGWVEDEALGKRVGDLLMNEEKIPYLGKIMDRLHRGQSWSGQLAFVKKSGEMFMAMVTKSPLYDDDDFVGVITVSSDAALLDDNCSEMLRGYQDQAHGPARTCKRVRWRRPPPIASSVSNLASKVFSRNRACGDNELDESCQVGDESGKKELAAPETVLIMHARKRGIEDNS